ncbi:MAG: hypothetical protein JW738_04590 [Actinobacteria bacterium]|nr:hypothetical protein [Actinomycetota bacterium]
MNNDVVNWTSTGNELSGYWISALVCDPEHETPYAGCNYGAGKPTGVWKYESGRWMNLEGGVSNFAVRLPTCGQRKNRTYVETHNHGVRLFRPGDNSKRRYGNGSQGEGSRKHNSRTDEFMAGWGITVYEKQTRKKQVYFT